MVAISYFCEDIITQLDLNVIFKEILILTVLFMQESKVTTKIQYFFIIQQFFLLIFYKLSSKISSLIISYFFV